MTVCRSPLTRLIVLPLFCAALLAQVQDLTHSESKRRIRAAKSLGQQKDADNIPHLAKLLEDPVPNVRLEVAAAITKIGTQHSLQPLMQATRDSVPEIQMMAVDGLVNFYHPGYVKAGWLNSVKSFSDSMTSRFSRPEPIIIDPSLRVDPAVIAAIGRIVVGGSSMESRANGARAAGILRGKAALPQLQEGLRSKNTIIILESVRAIEKIGDLSAGPSMVFLLRDLDEDVQFAVVHATGQLLVRDAVPELVGLVRASDNKNIRRQALIAIAKMPNDGQRNLFQTYLRDRDKELRAAAAEGIGRIGDKQDLTLITEAFEREKSESGRQSMAFAAVHLGSLDYLSYLFDGLNSSVHRGEAQPFLVELARKPEVLTELYTPLRAGTKDQKRELAYVLSVSGTRDSLPYLEQLTHDPEPAVAQAAIRAMKNLQARL